MTTTKVHLTIGSPKKNTSNGGGLDEKKIWGANLEKMHD
jgi:hypothetical protein